MLATVRELSRAAYKLYAVGAGAIGHLAREEIAVLKALGLSPFSLAHKRGEEPSDL